ncbi:MAG: acetolactate synthase small subunit [Actinobacteria bacterium]|nr:acetolactate synthase small subunit [Actinomycetota bacterium]
MKHTLSVLVENKPGVLTRISALFARRGFNIDSLAVGETEDPRLSRMTIAVDAQDSPLEQVTKQLHKLINVIKITDLDLGKTVARELALLKVKSDSKTRAEVMQLAEIFRANILDVGRKTLTIEITGTHQKIEALEQLLGPHGLVEIVRTGRIAIERGEK